MYIKRDSKYFIYLYTIDIISMVIAFFTSQLIRLGHFDLQNKSYCILLVLVVLSDLCSVNFMKNYNEYFDRGYFREFKAVVQVYLCTFLISLAGLYLVKLTSFYSRIFFVFFIILSVLFTYLARIWFKIYIMKKYSNSDVASKVMIVTTSDRIDDMYYHLHKKKYWDYSFSNVAVIDTDMTGEQFGKVQIRGNAQTMIDIARQNVVDEVLINIGYHNPRLQPIVNEFRKMGITVHIVLNNLNFEMPNPKIEEFSDFKVLTTCNNSITHRQLIIKRLIDIFGAMVGLILTGIISIFIVPAIKLESHGPAIYSQTRVGRNGRKFKIYKFRSMYTDADERKLALMKQNKMNGLMFKMDDDPRITKVGKFIRKTSIDELPQFYNVLKGEMSLVGTRPPTEDEFAQYSTHHKNRLSFKPGLTGLWQATGRSDITDFEEVVRLDVNYIERWSVELDIKLIVMTILGVIRKKGAE